MTGRRLFESARLAFFAGTGLAVPLYAFPLFRILGRQTDLATLLAVLFVLASLGAFAWLQNSAATWIWLAAAVSAPALALLPPAAPAFELSPFLVSYGHWLLLVAFFFSALSLRASERARSGIVLANVAAGAAVALFALYQAVGIPRHWPATGPVLTSFQREPFRLTPVGWMFPETTYVRPTSVFLEPAWMGGYLAWVFVLGMAVTLGARRGSGARTGLLGLALALILLAIVASVSWGAYVDLIVAAGACLTALLVSSRIPARRKILSIASLGLVFALAAASPPGRRVAGALSVRWAQLARTPIHEEQAGDPPPLHSDSSWVRVRNLEHSVRLFRAHAARGIGLGQFAAYARTEKDPVLTFTKDPWCGWIAIAAQVGAFGPLVLFSALLLVLLRWRRNRAGSVEDIVVPALVALAIVQQLHTGSFLDLWWWYPVSVAAALSGPSRPHASDRGLAFGIEAARS